MLRPESSRSEACEQGAKHTHYDSKATMPTGRTLPGRIRGLIQLVERALEPSGGLLQPRLIDLIFLRVLELSARHGELILP